MRGALLLAAFGAIVVGAFAWFYLAPTPSTSETVLVGTPVPFTVIASGEVPTQTVRANYVISTDNEFTQLWQIIDSGEVPPPVDFSTHEVLAVFAGKQPTRGYAIAISKVVDTATARVAVVSLVRPGASCAVAEYETEPYQVVVVRKSSLPLTHQDAVDTISCLK